MQRLFCLATLAGCGDTAGIALASAAERERFQPLHQFEFCRGSIMPGAPDDDYELAPHLASEGYSTGAGAAQSDPQWKALSPETPKS